MKHVQHDLDDPQVSSSASWLIRSLLCAGAFPHPADDVQLIETHISWVILAGDFVYKIKKPLRLGFLDFSTLERRRHYCEEEIRLNRPWAPDIYLGVTPVTAAGPGVRVGGTGEPLEYAVRMRRFDQSLRLDEQLRTGCLTAADMRELADMLATRHRQAPAVAADRREITLRRTIGLIEENFEPLDGVLEESSYRQLHGWTHRQLRDLDAFFGLRFDEGFFRVCHGDLHLGNIVRLPSGITTFDCIEFSDELRNIDVVADIAFLVMDLEERGQQALAYAFLNRYLEVSGDYDGMDALDLYVSYRCLVRAKIAVIRSSERIDATERQQDIDTARHYAALALERTVERHPLLITMCGLSGSGKTMVSGRLMGALPAIRVRSDIERKRHFGIGEHASSRSGIAAGLYTPAKSNALYAKLLHIAARLLAAGHNVILDAAFLHRALRDQAHGVARRCHARFVQVETVADEAVLRERLRARQAAGGDASEADTSVLDYQVGSAEMPAGDECQWTVRVSGEEQAGELVARVADVARHQPVTGNGEPA